MTTESRPMTLGELLDRTFSYYRAHLWTFVGIMLIPQLVLVLSIIMCVALLPLALLRPSVALMVVGVTAAVALFFVVYAAAYGATTFAVSEIHLGHPVTVRVAYRRVADQMGRLVALGLAILLRVLAWSITIVLSPIAILLLFWYAFSVPALLLENIGAGDALKRSRFLTKGQLGAIFVVWLLTGIVSVALTMVLQVPFVVAATLAASYHSGFAPWLMVLGQIAGWMAEALTAPLMMIALVMLYYDARVRKEGFDLELMMASMGSNPLPPVPAGLPPANSPAANS